MMKEKLVNMIILYINTIMNNYIAIYGNMQWSWPLTSNQLSFVYE